MLSLNRLLSKVIEYRASDLHLVAGHPPVLRIQGKLVPLEEEKILTSELIEEMVFSFLDKREKDILERERGLVLAYNFEGRLRFKIHLSYQKGLLSSSYRFIPVGIKSLAELGLGEEVVKWTENKKGFLVVSGPFGSGKSTTLASFLNEINQKYPRFIVSLEEPIEYILTSTKSMIEQREVGRDVLSFNQGLDFLTEEDVDVIMVSDASNSKVLLKLLELAEAGRLTVTQFNTISSLETIEKIDSSFEEDTKSRIREVLASSLVGIISQRLVPRIGGGEVLVAEIFKNTQACHSIIREGRFYQIESILQTSREEGMISLDRALALKVKTGEITLEVALEETSNPETLKRMVQI